MAWELDCFRPQDLIDEPRFINIIPRMSAHR